MLWIPFEHKIVSEYDQEIPQSQTADKPVALWWRATQQSQDTRKTNKPIKLIATLEWTQSNAQQNIENYRIPPGSNNQQQTHNNHKTPGRLTKQSNQTLFPIKMIVKLEWTQSNVQQNLENYRIPPGSNNQQQRITLCPF